MMVRCLGVGVLLLGWTAACAATTLVEDGKPRAAIVVPQAASDTLKLAAAELKEHLKLISGASLPVAVEGRRTRGAVVYLGATEAARARHLVPAEAAAGYDGYVLRSDGDGLFLLGRTDAGTLNAVYGLLEDHLGVRWYYPGPLGTVVPRQATIRLGALRQTSKPRYQVREPWYNGGVTAGWTREEQESYRVWRRRNRCGGPAGYVGHHWAYSIPPETHLRDHPDYYSLIQGERKPLQLCTANPDVVRLYTEDVLGRFRQPDFLYASLSPNDGGGWCECAACRAVSPDPTTRILTFINEVARGVAPRCPDRLLAFYAYADLVNPPATGLRCEPNVMPWVAHYSICQMHPLSDPRCPHQARFRKILGGWRAISRQLGVREYASWWPVPCAETRRLAADTRYYASQGAIAMSREYLEMQYGSHLLQWLESKLLWDPDRKTERLLAGFFARFYGPAGPRMRKVYDALAERQAVASPLDAQWTGNTFEAPGIFPRAMLAGALRRVRDAEASLPQGICRQRVSRERLALEAAVQFLDAWKADRDYAASGAEPERRTALEQLRKAVAVRDATPDNLVVSPIVREWASAQIRLLTTERTRIIRAGEWGFNDDLNQGGMARRDAERIEGLASGTWGLRLPAGGEGFIQYRFTAEGGLHFASAELAALFLAGGKGVRNRIEVQREGGPWQLFSEDKAYTGWEYRHAFTSLVAGAKEFRVRIWGKNETAEPALLLDNLGFHGTAE